MGTPRKRPIRESVSTSPLPMRFRSQIMPKRYNDVLCFAFIWLILPGTLIFATTIVLPECHNSMLVQRIFWMMAIFFAHNIGGNLLACMLIDTSIDTIIEKSGQPSNWYYCHECSRLTPPRSWHCYICQKCILKRDHHCQFAGCCIGHNNHRYFAIFLLYVFVTSLAMTIYTTIYFILKQFTLWECNFMDIIYLMIYAINVFAFVYSGILIKFHAPVILNGAIAFERHAPKFDLGWKNNLEMVFGKRMHLAWISPFIQSQLPHDGIHWESFLLRRPKKT